MHCGSLCGSSSCGADQWELLAVRGGGRRAPCGGAGPLCVAPRVCGPARRDAGRLFEQLLLDFLLLLWAKLCSVPARCLPLAFLPS